MRFGNWRGVAAVFTVAIALAATAPVRAQTGLPMIGGPVEAVDVHTGGPYMAPPVPYGLYAGKSGGGLAGVIGGIPAGLHGLTHPGMPCGPECGKDKDPSKGHHHKGLICFGHCATFPGDPALSSPQCSDPGCPIIPKHIHLHGPLLPGGKPGIPCAACGGKGCKSCGGLGVAICHGCGGAGCNLCGGNGGALHAIAGTLLHKGDIKYFVGPGGPVPLTPGYVPYIVTTRSPRDFLAFPPHVQ